MLPNRVSLFLLALTLTGCSHEIAIVPNVESLRPISLWPTIVDGKVRAQVPVSQSFTYPLTEDEFAVCLSGGGYRAMLFHVGVLWKLNELGLLHETKRITGVSGGAITAAIVGANWGELEFRDGVAINFKEQIAIPTMHVASKTVDVPSIVTGVLTFSTTGIELLWSSNSGHFAKALFVL